LAMRSIDVEAKLSDEVSGATCLSIAAYNGHLDICRLLIEKGAQLEVKSTEGSTPLHEAAEQGNIEIVRLLCDRGADIEARDDSEWRPLHYAAYYGHISIVEELIVDRDAEINARDDEGKTALGRARYIKVMTTLFHIWSILVQLLVRKMTIVPSAKKSDNQDVE